jgi:hypothetical protein
MKLSPLSKESYLRWITVETWHTNHYLDRQRFFDFVRTYLQYSRKSISANELREDIFIRYKNKLKEDYLTKEANYYSQLFADLIDFVHNPKW